MSKVHVCRSAEIPINEMKTFDMSDGRKVLIANAGDTFYAYQGICPHQEVCLGEGFFDGAVLTCHQHLWQWDITTGHAVGLAEAPLESYAVQVDAGDIFIVRESALKTAELFNGVSEATLDALGTLIRRQECQSGTVLYDAGDPTDDLYILESGRIAFQIGRDERTSAAGFVLHKGEVFGWAALLDKQPCRIARATCLDTAVVLRLNGEQALQTLAADPGSGYVVMRQLASLITRHLQSATSK